MPVSTKKIINFISEFFGGFTIKELQSVIIQPKQERDRSKRKRKKPYRSQKDIQKIQQTVEALQSAGFLHRVKNRYVVSNRFLIEGRISINASGNGLVKTDDGVDVTIRKESVGDAHHNDYVSARITDYRNRNFYGRVTEILRRSREQYLARVDRVTRGTLFLRILDLPGQTEVAAIRESDYLEAGDQALVELVDTPVSNRTGCRILEKFDPEDESSDIPRIILKYSLSEKHPSYKELDTIADDLPESEFIGRRDLRSLFTVTIDGEDAKDYDDAISIVRSDSTFTLYVHIADVSAYVGKNSQIDREAAERGTSFYLGYQVLPMLPEKLSNDLCSLRADIDRLAVTVEIETDMDGTVVRNDFYRSTIRVNKRLTYTGSSRILNEARSDETSVALKLMKELSFSLKERRMKEGRIDLTLSDANMVFSGASVKEIRFDERLDTHMIIEECMLSANVEVSRFLKEKQVPALYRIHEKISDDSLKSLNNFLKVLGIRMDKAGNTGINIQRVIDSVAGKEMEQVVNLVVLKSFMQAYYGIAPLGHFGLGFEDYTHFTSPIRRYPDLIVHRCLKSIIDNTDPPYTEKELAEIGEKSSEIERVAQSAERDLIKLKSCRLMSNRVGEIFGVIISGISRFGFYVTLIDMPVEGMVPLRYLTDDYYIVREDDYTVIGKRYSKRFRLGDKLEARLALVDMETMRIDFDLP